MILTPMRLAIMDRREEICGTTKGYDRGLLWTDWVGGTVHNTEPPVYTPRMRVSLRSYVPSIRALFLWMVVHEDLHDLILGV